MKMLFLVLFIISLPLFLGGCDDARGQWRQLKHDVTQL